MKEKAAKGIRIITAPPVLVTALLIILEFRRPEIFRDVPDYVISLLTLGLFPVLAYLVWAAVPKWRAQGRKSQRKLAFIGSLIGYALAFLYGEISKATPELKMLFRTYIIAVVLLTFVNKVLKVRASGHACSVVSPALFLAYYAGWRTLIISIAVVSASFWASLVLKRHKPTDLLWGSLVCITAFIAARLLYIL